MIQKAIKDRLYSQEGIRNLVDSRIYYICLPQNPTYPCISFYRVSNPRLAGLNMSSARFQFDVWSLKYSQAIEISNEIRLALKDEAGVWNNIPIIQGIYLNEYEDYENDTKLYHIACDYRINYREI